MKSHRRVTNNVATSKRSPAEKRKPVAPKKPARVPKTSSKNATTPSAAALKRAAEGALQTFELLHEAHPDAHCELDHQSPFQLIVATVLSAQSTDVAVNQVTPELFHRWPTPDSLAAAAAPEVESVLARLGMFRQKSKNIINLAKQLVEHHAGEVPKSLSQLVELSGVGRKTANVVLGVAFGRPEGVVVDTHVQRVSQRLGWTTNTTPELIEKDLMALFPEDRWDILSHTLIFHGRRVCAARKPACAACAVVNVCPHAFRADAVGRKPGRPRPASTPLPAKQPKTR